MSRQDEVDKIFYTLRADQKLHDRIGSLIIKKIAEYLIDNGIGTKSRFEAELPANFDKEYEDNHAQDICNVLNLTRIRPIDYQENEDV